MRRYFAHKQSGLTLIELIIAIVVIGVGFSGLMWSYSNIISRSADPVIHQQAINIANSLMEEVVAKSYPDASELADSTCDAPTGNRDSWGDVCDYHTYSSSNITDIVGNDTNIDGYSFAVTVEPDGNTLGLADDNDALLITVTVSHPLGTSIALSTYRTNY